MLTHSHNPKTPQIHSFFYKKWPKPTLSSTPKRPEIISQAHTYTVTMLSYNTTLATPADTQQIPPHSNYRHTPTHSKNRHIANANTSRCQHTADTDIQQMPTHSRQGQSYIPMKTIRGALYGGEIQCLRRLRREGSPERLSRS